MAGETILVVDDSRTILNSTSMTLRSHGYRVLMAGDGEQALFLARRERPDLIVLDIILPKVNGFQVCRELKKDPETQGIKIILFSSKNQESDRFWGLRQGADSYMTKPYEDEQLLTAIGEMLGTGPVAAAPTATARPDDSRFGGSGSFRPR